MGFATVYFSRVGRRQQLQLRVSCMKCTWVPLAGSPLLGWFWSGKFTFQRNFYFLLDFLKITYLSREKNKSLPIPHPLCVRLFPARASWSCDFQGFQVHWLQSTLPARVLWSQESAELRVQNLAAEGPCTAFCLAQGLLWLSARGWVTVPFPGEENGV